jgi:outer membrane protein assembly complex protein YaeT
VRRAALLVVLAVAACASREPAEEPEPDPGPEVVFVGNDRVGDWALRNAARRELQSFAQRRQPADAADAAYSMEQELRGRGYPRGKVTFHIEPQKVTFTVVEGPRAYLDEVRFEGRESVPPDTLLQFFDFEGAGPLGTGRPLFNLADIEGATSKVERFYLREGFFQVRVKAPVVTWSEDQTLATVTIAVEEGRWFSVAAVEFDGMDPVHLDLVGRPYHARLVVAAAALLRSRLHNEGRIFSEVTAAADVDEATGRVVIRLVVKRSPEIRLRKLEIEGNERTREWFLRHRIPLEENDLVRQELLDQGIDSLYRSGLFNAVRTRLDRVAPDLTDLTISLEEAQARSVDFEVGYGSYELARGAIRYRNRNLFGTGRHFRAELKGSVRSYGADLAIEDPYILGNDNVLQVSGGYEFREEPSFDYESYRVEVMVRRTFSRKWGGRIGYRIRDEEASNLSVPGLDLGFITAAGLFTSVRRTTLDSFLLPTRGSNVDLGVFWSSPSLGADLDFVEPDLRVTQLFSLASRTVLGFGARYRTRHILNDLPTLPIQERLFMGGPNDVRSFYRSELGPSVGGEPLGGLTALHGNIELRQGIWREFYTALFYDFGWLSPNSFSVNVPPGHAVGVGFRYYLPVGPIRLDVAYNPGRLFAASSRWAIHLAVGFSF